jgi:manganese/zinc/iron transport system permease protein
MERGGGKMIQIEILLIAVVVSIACALPGVFLVLRKMSLMSDAISHSILLGIVLAFFITGNIESPLLVIGAIAMGIITVSLTELLAKTKLVYKDTSIGMIFPILFSIGVILVSRFAGNVHLDTDAVLLGELALAPFDRFILWGIDLGPRSLIFMGMILLINIGIISVFFKELKIGTFDPGLAAALGLMPGVIHYGLMLMVSVTAVGAFESVGSILVVALMIAPPAGALLLTEKLSLMLMISGIIAVVSSILGFFMAQTLDVSIAGSMATMTGIVFLIIFLFAPKKGIVALVQLRITQKWEFATQMLLVHLLHHEKEENAHIECHKDHLQRHINWTQSFAGQVVLKTINRNLINEKNGLLGLTTSGREYAIQAMVRK